MVVIANEYSSSKGNWSSSSSSISRRMKKRMNRAAFLSFSFSLPPSFRLSLANGLHFSLPLSNSNWSNFPSSSSFVSRKRRKANDRPSLSFSSLSLSLSVLFSFSFRFSICSSDLPEDVNNRKGLLSCLLARIQRSNKLWINLDQATEKENDHSFNIVNNAVFFSLSLLSFWRLTNWRIILTLDEMTVSKRKLSTHPNNLIDAYSWRSVRSALVALADQQIALCIDLNKFSMQTNDRSWRILFTWNDKTISFNRSTCEERRKIVHSLFNSIRTFLFISMQLDLQWKFELAHVSSLSLVEHSNRFEFGWENDVVK